MFLRSILLSSALLSVSLVSAPAYATDPATAAAVQLVGGVINRVIHPPVVQVLPQCPPPTYLGRDRFCVTQGPRYVVARPRYMQSSVYTQQRYDNDAGRRQQEQVPVYNGPPQHDPRGETAPYAGAIREGGCQVPGAVYIKEVGGCVGRVTDRATMEKYRLPIADVCGGQHGPVQRPVPGNGMETYMCP